MIGAAPLSYPGQHDGWEYKPQSLGGLLSTAPARLQQFIAANIMMPCQGPSGTPPLLYLQCPNHPFIESSDTQFWTNLYTMDVTSDECLSKIQILLTCSSMIAVARSFRGNQAQMFIDFLDRVSRPYTYPVLQPSEALNTGPFMLMPRRQAPAARFTAPLKDMQCPGHHSRLICPSRRGHIRRKCS